MAKINKTTGVYTGKVTHFSTINTDLSKTDASCLKVVLNSSIPAGMRLRITDVPGGVDFAQTFEFTMNDVVNAVYRLPPNTNVKLDLLDLNNNILGNLSVEEIPGISLPGNIINSGPPIPAGHTLWPDPNTTEIDDCKAVTLSLKIPDWSGFPASPFLTFKGVGDATKAAGYYSTVDPSNLRTTLGDWWSANGFDIDGQAIDAVRTSYLNNNDLGSGRDMYLLQHPDGRVSAYVTNYGLFDQNPANADLADTKTNPGATVCMEFSPVEGAAITTKIVKFFVFAGNGNGALAPRVTSANLDGAGDKYVPNLCLNCHGGSYVPANPAAPVFDEVNMHASLREFDLATYKYPGFRTIPNSGEKDRFKQQNIIVKASQPQQAIVELIDGWYAGGTSDQNAGYAPPGWSGAPQTQLYHDVVSASCRTCHVAFESDAGPFGLNWVTYAQFRTRRNVIRDYVCGTDKVMPHALVTYKNFWLSTNPSRPASLGAFTTVDWTAFGSCQ
jgi:cytochrome c5